MALVGESTALQRDLVFDFGFHRGEDTGHYLAMGHRVVAVDASAELIAAGRERFAAQLASGQLTLVHGALIGAAQRADTKELLFYPHPQRSDGAVWTCVGCAVMPKRTDCPMPSRCTFRRCVWWSWCSAMAARSFSRLISKAPMPPFWRISRDFLCDLNT